MNIEVKKVKKEPFAACQRFKEWYKVYVLEGYPAESPFGRKIYYVNDGRYFVIYDMESGLQIVRYPDAAMAVVIMKNLEWSNNGLDNYLKKKFSPEDYDGILHDVGEFYMAHPALNERR